MMNSCLPEEKFEKLKEAIKSLAESAICLHFEENIFIKNVKD